MVEELTGEMVHWDEDLSVLKTYERDLMPWEVERGDAGPGRSVPGADELQRVPVRAVSVPLGQRVVASVDERDE